MTNVTVGQLNGKTILPDKDRILLESVAGACPNSEIQIGLRFDGVTWWKGIEADNLVLAQTQDSGFLNLSEISYELFSALQLNLWKAKAFGIHTYMYTVTDAHENMQGGNRYVFNWLSD